MGTEGENALLGMLSYGSPNANNYLEIAELLCMFPHNIEFYEEYSMFQWTLTWQELIPVQELLKRSTLNDNQCEKIHLNILIWFGKDSDFILKVIDSIMDVESRDKLLESLQLDESSLYNQHYFLFSIDVAYLRSFLGRFCPCIYDLYKIVFGGKHNFYFSNEVPHDQVITCLESILESGPKMNHLVVRFISKLDWRLIFDVVKKNGEKATTELLLFLIRNGLRLETSIYDAVRGEFGYCELFKILLHMDVVKTKTFSSETSLMTSLIIDVYSNLEDYLDKDYLVPGICEVMDYFAHPKLMTYLRKFSHILPHKYQKKFDQHPTVPRLMEIARNALRRHLVMHFQIYTTKQFYTLVNNLFLSDYTKIITFETKLY